MAVDIERRRRIAATLSREFARGELDLSSRQRGFCQNSDNDAKSGAIWGRETAFAESDGGPRED